MTGYDRMMTRYEHEPKLVDTFAVIDLDRTLLNTSRLVEILCRQLLDHGVSIEQVEQDIMFIEAQSGQSFSLLDFFEAQYGPEIFGKLQADVLQLAASGAITEELLCLGASEVLDQLDSDHVPYAILTYGEPQNQEYKLDILATLLHRDRSSLRAQVTSQSKKAEWIASSWRSSDDGRIVVPAVLYDGEPIHTETVAVIDDKAANLESDEKRVYGILVNNTDPAEDRLLTTADVAVLLSEGKTLLEIAAVSDSRRETSQIDKP